VILFTILSKRPPFTSADPRADPIYALLASGQYDVFWYCHSKARGGVDIYSAEFKHLFEMMTQFKESRRITMRELVNHPWVSGPLPELDQISMEFTIRKFLVDREQERKEADKQRSTLKILEQRPAYSEEDRGVIENGQSHQ
jgi:hypothetical protein